MAPQTQHQTNSQQTLSAPAADIATVVATLRARLDCPVYGPADDGYATEAAAFNTAIVHKTHAVVAVRSTNDVAEVVRAARGLGALVSVQATGHGALGAIAGGILISTRALQGVRIDPETRVATIAGGSRWAPVVTAAAEHGLAPIIGSSLTVGAVGYLLGGGMGPLARSHGFSSDYIVGMTVVTGAGDVVEADARNHPDLFWALRGGKSGLGIVTELRLRLVELRAVYGGSIYFDEPHIEQALRGWIDWTRTADPRLTTSIAIVKFPPLEVIPAPLRGRRLLALRVAYPGDPAEGERLAQPLRALAPIHLDGVRELKAVEVDRIHNDPTEPTPSWVRGQLLTHVDQDFASTLLGYAGAGTDSPFVAAEVRHIGGATGNDVPETSATGGRGAQFTLSFIGVNPTLFEVMPAAYARITDDVRPWNAAETNINFMARPRSDAHLATAWPAATFARLAEVRRRYDPDGVMNPNSGY